MNFMDKTLTVVIPAYNEEASLRHFLPHVINHCNESGYTLIVVNDGSTDNTKAIIQQFEVLNPVLHVIHHKVNRGYGGAIKSGIKQTKTDYLITIDADGQHNLNDVDRLFQEIISTDADMIVGSRISQKSATALRGIGKMIIRKIAKFLLPVRVQDINSGMKIYSSQLAKNYIHMCPDSMAFSDIIVLVFTHYRCLVMEVPIKVGERLAGKSTIGVNTAFETVREILNIVLLFNPLKIFLPVSFLVFVSSLLWGLPILFSGRGLSTGTLLGLFLSVFLFFLGVVAEQISILQKKKL